MRIPYRFLFFILMMTVLSCKQSASNRVPIVKHQRDKGSVLVVPKDAFIFEEMVYRENEDGIDTLNYISIDIKTGKADCFVAKDLPLGMRVDTKVDNGDYRSTLFSIEYYDLGDVKYKTVFRERFNYDDLSVQITNENENPAKIRVIMPTTSPILEADKMHISEVMLMTGMAIICLVVFSAIFIKEKHITGR